MRPPRCIDLFCGCGGLSTGLLDAGVDVRLGVDLDAPSLETFDVNHRLRGSESLRADARELRGHELVEACDGHVDLIVGGPPCQPFSVAGKRQALDDLRGDLIFEFVRLTAETQADAYIFENVPNLATVADGAVLESLVRAFEGIGYSATASVLLAADYGVPQMRKRLFVVGTRERGDVSMPPPPTHATPASASDLPPHVTASAALDDLPDVTERAAEFVPNHEPTFHGEQMLAALRRLPPGKREPKSRHDRLHPDRPGYTLRAGTGNYSPLRPIHHQYHRVVSVRECARLQSFSDDFLWPDDLSRLQQYKQVGNAVPPRLAAALGRHLAKHMRWKIDERRFAVAGPPPAKRLTLAERLSRREQFMRGGASKATLPNAA